MPFRLYESSKFPGTVYFISDPYPLANSAFFGQKTIGQAGFSQIMDNRAAQSVSPRVLSEKPGGKGILGVLGVSEARAVCEGCTKEKI